MRLDTSDIRIPDASNDPSKPFLHFISLLSTNALLVVYVSVLLCFTIFWYFLRCFTMFDFQICLGIDLFQISQVNCPWRSAWIATFRPCKKSCSISGRRRRRPPATKRWGRSNPRWEVSPYFVCCWLFDFFFFPAPFVGAQMVFSEHILTVGLYVRVWQAWISGFAGAPERGWFSYNQCLGWIMRGPVPIVVTVWSSGGEFPRFESQDASLRPLKSLCLIVWLFVYLCCQVLNTIHLPWLIKPPSQQYLAQDQHFLKLATSCQSATFG